jgi:thiamine biosynthesis lipoprotein
MLINLNSCVRPYAVDSVRRIFAKEGVKSAMISLDHDVATIGRQHDGANWLVGIKHPKGSGAAITRVKLNNKGYSVRGDFEHCQIIDKERFGSALSPVDGRPIPGLVSVGVMADTCLAACGAASIAHIKTEQAGLRWLAQLGLPWVAVDKNLQCHGLLG